MSGLFQRIARRRAGDPDGAEAPASAQPGDAPAQPRADASAPDQSEGGAHVQPGPDAPAPAQPDAPTRYIGAPAPESPHEVSPPATPHAEGDRDRADTTRPDTTAQGSDEPGATTAFAAGEQPTVLFPLMEQPTEASPPLPSDAALSAAATGATPLSIGTAAAGEQPTSGAHAASGEQAPSASGEQANPGEQPTIPVERRPGFRERGRMRRRLRYLRRLRELQVRDLGGLAFDLRRFERKRDDLIAQKIDQIRACDDELSSLETVLDERRDIRDVRMPGIGGTCPRCFSLYGSSDRFCAHCGAALGGLAQGPAQVAAPLPPPPDPPGTAQPAPPGPPAPETSPPPASPPSPPTEPTPPR
jgi:hypothetical protein